MWGGAFLGVLHGKHLLLVLNAIVKAFFVDVKNICKLAMGGC